MELIDAYSHCGVSKYEPIEQVAAVLDACGVSRAVLVQHLGEFDNSYIGGIALAEPQRFAGVCLIDHAAPDAVDTLASLARSGGFKGVRLTSEACLAAPHILRAASDLGLVVVLYAPDGVAGAVEWLAPFLETHPATRLVVTHLGKPDLSAAPEFPEERNTFRLAEYPGVFYQVSGMKMYCPFPHSPLYGLIEQALRHFGPERLLWGSNYPVVGNADDYRADLNLVLEGGLPLPADAIAAVAGDNARRLWFA